MDINHIQLNPAALAGLYKNHLVTSGRDAAVAPVPAIATGPSHKDEPATNVAAPANITVKSLGNNERKVLILVRHQQVVFLPDEELKFLTGILAACKLSIADVAIVNLQSSPATGYKDLLAQFNSTKVLLFGLEPSAISLPMDFPAFQLQAFNGTTYHWCADLASMENDRSLKTQLWNNLKKLFTI